MKLLAGSECQPSKDSGEAQQKDRKQDETFLESGEEAWMAQDTLHGPSVQCFRPLSMVVVVILTLLVDRPSKERGAFLVSGPASLRHVVYPLCGRFCQSQRQTAVT